MIETTPILQKQLDRLQKELLALSTKMEARLQSVRSEYEAKAGAVRVQVKAISEAIEKMKTE